MTPFGPIDYSQVRWEPWPAIDGDHLYFITQPRSNSSLPGTNLIFRHPISCLPCGDAEIHDLEYVGHLNIGGANMSYEVTGLCAGPDHNLYLVIHGRLGGLLVTPNVSLLRFHLHGPMTGQAEIVLHFIGGTDDNVPGNNFYQGLAFDPRTHDIVGDSSHTTNFTVQYTYRIPLWIGSGLNLLNATNKVAHYVSYLHEPYGGYAFSQDGGVMFASAGNIHKIDTLSLVSTPLVIAPGFPDFIGKGLALQLP